MLERQQQMLNRFGSGPRQAPMAPMQQQQPGVLEQIGTSAATSVGTDLAKDGMKDAWAMGKEALFGPAGVDVAAADAATMAVPEATFGATAAPMAELGAAGLAEGATAAGLETAAMSGAAGAGAGGAAALGAAMPWVGAGLLAGKAFGLFSKGGSVDPSQLTQDGPLYKAEGGDTGGFWNYLKKSFTEKPEWENYEPVQVPVLDGNGNPTNATSTVYRPNPNAAPAAKPQPAPVEDHSVNLEKAIARDIYGEYDDGEDMGDASYLAGDPAPYSVQTYPLARRGEIQMKSNTPPKGGPLLRKFGAPGIRRDPQEFNRDLNEYSIKRNNRLNPQPDDGSGIWEDMKGFFKSMGQSNGDDADVSGFNMGGRVGPLKSTQYKSAGGEVYTESYYDSSKK